MPYLKLILLLFGAFTLHAQDFRTQYREKTLKQFPNSEQDFYPDDDSFRILADYKLLKKGKIISIPTSGTKIKDYKAYALISFTYEGKKYKLTVYQPQPVMPLYRDHLFLPLKDATAPHETYGGGRYMDLSVADFKEGKVILDFNTLYNPYCAFSDGWNCPIPPKNNVLPLAVKAGEKIPLKTEYDQH